MGLALCPFLSSYASSNTPDVFSVPAGLQTLRFDTPYARNAQWLAVRAAKPTRFL